ncbi:hypothetical protein MBLNU457_6844t1 [Dothideomycetes sp. NU457]
MEAYTRSVAPASSGLQEMAFSNPTSNILSDRLRESRIKSKRTRRRTDFGPLGPHMTDDIFLAEAESHSSDIPSRVTVSATPSGNHYVQSRSDNGFESKLRQTNGLREMDEKLEKLEKLNFDLKMEVHHRRQREEKLQAQLKSMAKQIIRAEKIQHEHAELIKINDSLVKELEKRDDAVREAVEMIVDLEAKNDALQSRSLSQSMNSDSGYGALDTPKVIPPSSPEFQAPFTPLSGRPAGAPYAARQSHTRNRIPSFVSDANAGTQALREVYLDPARNLRPVKSFMSILSERESNQGDMLQDLGSPRLSVLSESSFPSIYGVTRPVQLDQPSASEHPQKPTEDDLFNADQQQDSIKRVSKWMMDDTTTLSPMQRLELAPKLAHRSPFSAGLSRSTTAPQLSPSEAGASILRDLSLDLDDYPTGGSIDLGTPSRFQTKHTKSPAVNMMLNGDDINQNQRSTPRRRQSSAEIHAFNASISDRPSYQRAGTSPQTTAFRDSNQIHESDNSFIETTDPSLRSPGSSSRKSVRASFAQKTQNLFRRMSNGQSDSPPARPTPQPETKHKKRVSLAANTLAPTSHSRQSLSPNAPLHRTDSHHDKSLGPRSDRRRSVDAATALQMGLGPHAPGTRQRGTADLSKHGAQAAWEVSSGGTSRSGSFREREEVKRGADKRWKA